ncbi:short-chain dehydrogenase reductase 3b-like [Punica granatum]|uniref:Uncharacterized protein n=2 Tax=Punica granatum TaxID=22663 RepID=A0A218XEA6_PUNGR|nr:short-chain dehydrogenase reductase 3b-like [Punica granatum]OWM83287.1 hypothetical protein CDL15_Pgr012768 [Punica granatum]PKI74005.1 hypothetical protein CRG98_005622 [Punica granatum]
MEKSSSPSSSCPKKKIDGRVAIVTGGASGIGEETVHRFVEHGAFVVIADIQDERGQALVSTLGLNNCAYVHCDVSDEDQVSSLVNSTVERHGRVDIMFSNAGIINPNQDILGFDIPMYDRLFGVNVRGTIACVKHAARAMVEGGVRGSIICTASVVASMGYPEQIDYVMSKHAVLGLVRSAAKGLGQHGIRVNCASPGPMGTSLLRGLLGLGEGEVESHFEPFSQLKGVLKVHHVADAVVFLASDEAEFITGHNLAVDGCFRSDN